MYEERRQKSRYEAVVRCVGLLGLKNPTNLKQLEKTTYLHTNTRGRKRVLKVYETASLYFENADQSLKLHKVQGYYITEERL